MRRRRPNSRAFTLIELLIVLAMIGLIASLLGVALAGNLGSAQRERDQQAMHTALLEARAQAMRTHAASVAVFEPAVGDEPATLTTPFRVIEFETPLTVVNASRDRAAAAWVVFSPDGVASAGTTDRAIPLTVRRELPLARLIDQGETERATLTRTGRESSRGVEALGAPTIIAVLRSLHGTTERRWILADQSLPTNEIPDQSLLGPFAPPVAPVGVFERMAAADARAEDERTRQRGLYGPTSDTRLVPTRGITQRMMSRAQEAQRLADQARERSQQSETEADDTGGLTAGTETSLIDEPPSGLARGLIMPLDFVRTRVDDGTAFGPNGERVELTVPARLASSASEALAGRLWAVAFEPLSGAPLLQTD